nr:P0 protein [Citrus vein enation virus]
MPCYHVIPYDYFQPIHSSNWLGASLLALINYVGMGCPTQEGTPCEEPTCVALPYVLLCALALLWGHPRSCGRRGGVSLEALTLPRGFNIVGPPDFLRYFRICAARIGLIIPQSYWRDDGRRAIPLTHCALFTSLPCWLMAASGKAEYHCQGYVAPELQLPGDGPEHTVWVEEKWACWHELIVGLLGTHTNVASILRVLPDGGVTPHSQVLGKRNLIVDAFTSISTMAVGTDQPPPNRYMDDCSLTRLFCLREPYLSGYDTDNFSPGLHIALPWPEIPEGGEYLAHSFAELDQEFADLLAHLHVHDDEEDLGWFSDDGEGDIENPPAPHNTDEEDFGDSDDDDSIGGNAGSGPEA